jgi:DUF2934 family protein
MTITRDEIPYREANLLRYRPPTTVIGPILVHELIAQRAYHIWQSRGCPAGTELQDWLQAKSEVAAEIRRARRSHPAEYP